MADLTTDLGFLKLKNPVITASGTFGYGLEFIPFFDLNRLGGLVVKGLYLSPRKGNPPPRLVETSSGLINAIGLQGIGVKKFTEEILPQLTSYDTAIIVNVCGETEEEYSQVVEYLNDFEGISAYELNISCPNVKQGGMCPAQDPKATFSVVSRVKLVSRRPIITKLSPNVTNIVTIARSAEDAGSDAVSLVNTLLAMAIDIETRRPKLANQMGGLSGPAIKPVALRMVYQAASALTIPVIGMGGISTGRDVLEFMLAGAQAVQVGTSNFIDPKASVNIVKEIEALCTAQGIERIQDIIGKMERSI